MAIRKKTTKWTNESFAKAVSEISPSIIVVGNYTRSSDNIECHCSVCDNIWFPVAGNLLKGTGCPECARIKQSKRMKTRVVKRHVWTQSSVKKRVYEIDPNIEVIGNYTKTSEPIECRCKKCGATWNPTANNLLQGRSHCPDCAQKAVVKSTQMTHDEFIKRVKIVNKNILILGQYTTTKAPILCRCKTCGYEWSPIGDSLLSGKGCRRCAYKENQKKAVMSHEEFISKLSQINENITILDLYKGTYNGISCKCNVCGNEWRTKPHYLLTGRGCSECSHTSTSYIEQFLLCSFRLVLGEKEVLSRNKTAIGKELDIYIPKYRLAVEPGSWKLHKEKTNTDRLKKELCHGNGIRLITVYYDYNGIVNDEADIFYYSQDLSKKSEQPNLIALFYTLLHMIGIDHVLSDDDWKGISNLAYIKSRRITTEQFRERLKEVNPNIRVLGEYKSSRTKTLCRCDICGNEWKVAPGDLLSGRGCPACYERRRSLSIRYTEEDFITLLNERNPNIEPLETYNGSKERIRCRCKKCNYIWNPQAASIVKTTKPSGCPKCAGTLKLDTKSFVELMKTLNPSIEILGEYVNTETGIKCRCRSCLYEWNPKPHSLKAGHGCPYCSKKEGWKKRRLLGK